MRKSNKNNRFIKEALEYIILNGGHCRGNCFHCSKQFGMFEAPCAVEITGKDPRPSIEMRNRNKREHCMREYARMYGKSELVRLLA